MKDSGCIWIGKIPVDWIKAKIKHIKDENHPYPIGDGDHGSIKPEHYLDSGIPYIRVQNISWNGTLLLDNVAYISEEVNNANLKSILYPGDIIVAKTGGTIGKTAIIPDSIERANTTSSVGKISVSKKYCNRYFFYQIMSDVCFRQMWEKANQKSAQPGFNIEDLVEFEVALPPLSEQQAISAHLDRQCGLIDSVIEKTKASVEEYKKLRQAVITQAVTKGVRGDRPMKDSGIEWIGEIPEEWDIVKFKYIATVKSNLVHPNEYPNYMQIAPDNIEKGNAKLLECKTVEEIGVESDNHLFYKGQIIYSKIRPILNKVIIAPFDGLCSADMYPIETSINKYFLVYMMLSDRFLAQVKLVTENRVKMPKINQEELGQILIYKPPIDEQQEISEYLNKKCNEIDSLINKKEQFLTELESYKKSMIYEYVTGKKEVPQS